VIEIAHKKKLLPENTEDKMHEESPDTIHGRMKEGAHLAGYGLSRAMDNLKWLLEGERFKELSAGYADVNEFLRGTEPAFKLLRIDPKERKQIAALVKELQPDASQRAIADMVGASDKTIGKDLGAEYSAPKDEIIEEITIPAAEKSAPLPWTTDDGFDPGAKGRREQRRREREAERYVGEAAPLPDDKYRVVYADPPWKYREHGVSEDAGYGSTKFHYNSMTTEEIAQLPIGNLVDDNAVLFIWVTSPKLNEVWKIIDAWGFEYKTSFVWDKIRHNFGYYNSVRHEFLLVCGRGQSTPDAKKLYDSVQQIDRSEVHSEKPEEFREIIDALYTYGKRLELFARSKRDGWDTWGDEL